MITRAPDVITKMVMDDKAHHKAMVRAGRDMAKFERETKLAAKASSGLNAKTRSAASSASMASAAYMKLGLAIGAAAVAAKAIDSVLAHGLTSQGVYQALPFSIDATAKAMGGLASNFEIAKHASRQAALGLNFTAEQFQDLAKAAAIAGQKMGIDASFALDRLITGLGRASPKLLDDLGIMVKAGKANREYAAALGITTQAMSDAQKETAFRTFALKELNRVASTGTLITKGMGAEWAQTKVKVVNAWDSVTRAISGSKTLMDAGRESIKRNMSAEEEMIRTKRGHIVIMSVLNPALRENLELEFALYDIKRIALILDTARIKVATDLTKAHINRLGEIGKLNKLVDAESKRHQKLTDSALKQALAMSKVAAATTKAANAEKLRMDALRNTTSMASAIYGAQSDISDADIDASLGVVSGGITKQAGPLMAEMSGARTAEMDAAETKLAMDARLVESNAAVSQSYIDLASNGLASFADGMAGAIDAAVSGQMSFGQAMQAMLSSTLRTVAKQATVKSIMEGAEAIASLAILDFRGAALHGAASAGFAAVAGAAYVGSALTATSSGASTSAARTPGGSLSTGRSSGSTNEGSKELHVSIHYDRSDPHALRMAQAKIWAEMSAAA